MKRLIVLILSIALIITFIPVNVSAANLPEESAVKNLRVSAVTYNSVRLSWDAVPGAKGYQIYKSTSKNGKYYRIKSTKYKTYNRKNLTTNKVVYYKVRAYATVGGKTIYGKFSSKVAGKPVLKVPETSLTQQGNTIKVSWNKIPGATKYEVFRSNTADGTYTKVSSPKSTATSWSNTGLASGQTYYYKVRAVRFAKKYDRRGTFSEVKSASCGLGKPEVKPVSTTAGIDLTWPALTGAEGYEVSRSESESGTYTVLGEVQTNAYKDTNVTSGKTYYYRVRAFKTVDGAKVYGDYSGNTSKYSRTTVINNAKAWAGARQGSATHHEIIDLYNANRPSGYYKMTYSDAWCATYVSAVAVKSKVTAILPMECSCQRMITLFQNKKSWVENDAYKPLPGDVIFFDWNDGTGYATKDNTAVSHHVGLIYAQSGDNMTTIEGNTTIKNANGVPITVNGKNVYGVEYRTMKVNGRYIRGFGVPKYDADPGVTYSASATAKAMGTEEEDTTVVIETEDQTLEIQASEDVVDNYDAALDSIEKKTNAKAAETEYDKMNEIMSYIDKNMQAPADVENKSAYYSRLVYDICNEQGIFATMETVDMDGELYSWNIVSLDGKTYAVDMANGRTISECQMTADDVEAESNAD